MNLIYSNRKPLTPLAMCDKGGVSIFIGFTIVILVVICGIGIDVMRSQMVRTKMQASMDAAALAAGSLPMNTPDAERIAVAQRYFSANYPPSYMGGDLNGVDVAIANGRITVSGGTAVATNYMPVNNGSQTEQVNTLSEVQLPLPEPIPMTLAMSVDGAGTMTSSSSRDCFVNGQGGQDHAACAGHFMRRISEMLCPNGCGDARIGISGFTDKTKPDPDQRGCPNPFPLRNYVPYSDISTRCLRADGSQENGRHWCDNGMSYIENRLLAQGNPNLPRVGILIHDGVCDRANISGFYGQCNRVKAAGGKIYSIQINQGHHNGSNNHPEAYRNCASPDTADETYSFYTNGTNIPEIAQQIVTQLGNLRLVR